MNKNNSASRALDILKQAYKHNDTDKIFEVWANVFDINEDDQNRKNMEITRCLSMLHDEIDSIHQDIDLDKFDEFGCAALLNLISSVLAVHALMGEWKALKPKLTREVFLCLGYCREVLPDEEETIKAEDIEELHELIASLIQQLNDSSLPAYTKKLIQNHIDRILKALHSYKIKGASSLQGAMNTIIGEVVTNSEVLHKAKGTPEISALGKIINKLHNVTDGVIKTEKLLSSSEKVINRGARALEVINDLL